MTKALLATLVVLALTDAACGGGGSDCTPENATELTGTVTVSGSLAAAGLFVAHVSSASFSPDCFSATSGSTIPISNEDVIAHTFTVRDTDIDVRLPGGETGQATAPAPGTYDFVCTLHPSMNGTIIVT